MREQNEKTVRKREKRRRICGEQMMTLGPRGCLFIAKDGLSLMLDHAKRKRPIKNSRSW